MKRAIAIGSAMAIALCAVITLSAFAGPDFSGKWTPEPAAAGAGGGGGRGGGSAPMTIAMDAKTITITRTMGGNDMKSTYNLDGSESKNMGMGRGGAAGTEQVSTAKWDGATLVITTGTNIVKYSMDGAKLKVETTRPGRNGGDPTTTATTYTKG